MTMIVCSCVILARLCINIGKSDSVWNPQSEIGEVMYRGERHPNVARTATVLTLLLLSSLLNISLVVLMVAKKSDETPHKEPIRPTDNAEGNICVPCGSDIIADGGTISRDVEVVKVDRHQLMCCLTHAEGWIHLIKLFQGIHQVEKEVSEQNPNATHKYLVSRPSAHLFLNQKDFKGDAMTWSVEPGLHTAHVTGNIKFANDSINIQEDGLYDIYSSATFVARGTTSDLTPKYVKHLITRKNTQHSDIQVLFSKPTILPNTPGKFVNCYLQDNIKLEFGDVLTVQLSNYSYLYNYSVSTFWGIYRL